MRDLSGWTALHPKSCPSPNPKGPFRMLPALTSPHGGKLLDRNANTALEDFILLQTRHQATLFGGSSHPQPRSSDRAGVSPRHSCHRVTRATWRHLADANVAALLSGLSTTDLFLFFIYLFYKQPPASVGLALSPARGEAPASPCSPPRGPNPLRGHPAPPGPPAGAAGGLRPAGSGATGGSREAAGT